jgi:hypothetical protein
MDKNLSAMPYAQAKVIIMDNGNIILRSYYTDAAMIRSDGWLTINGLYSATTRKHIGAFVKEYANISYQLAKQLYNDKMNYNIYTGEVAPI